MQLSPFQISHWHNMDIDKLLISNKVYFGKEGCKYLVVTKMMIKLNHYVKRFQK